MKFNLFKGVCWTVLLTFTLTLTAQKAQYKFSEGKSDVTVLVDLDRDQLSKEDSISKEIAAPMRVAILYPLEVNMSNAGKWQTLADSQKVWKLTINAPQSHGVIVRYSDFYIPEGGKLYVYNEDNKKDSWIYTHNQNPNGGRYSNEVLSGDKITLEYVAPKASAEQARLNILEIGYKYREVEESFYVYDNKLKSFNDYRNRCMPNINCDEGRYWQNQKKGVVRIRVQTSVSTLAICTGSLVNNTNEDKAPYILTAYHCFFSHNGKPLYNLETTEFNFNYETPECENSSVEPPFNQIYGADMLVANPMFGGSDGVLLKMKQNIPSTWSVYYNGWSRENNPNNIESGAIIHHPQGDVKKITLYAKSPISGAWDGQGGPSAPGAHWLVNYSVGATEPGSSGAPMFNQNGLIVGTLSGGSSSCNRPMLADYYGKLWYHWDQSADPSLHMSQYLDPKYNGTAQSLGGLDVTGTPNPNPGDQPALIVFIKDNKLYINTREILKRISIFDLSGRKVFSKSGSFDGSTYDIDITGWNNGVYAVSVDAGKHISKSVKVIK